MQFIPQKKTDDIIGFRVILPTHELDEIKDGLFKNFKELDSVHHIILDDLVGKYVKSIVADTFMSKNKILTGVIYHLEVHMGESIPIRMMLSRNEKINKVLY